MQGRKKIAIYDTTLRDGAQTEGISLSLEDKLRIAAELESQGHHLAPLKFKLRQKLYPAGAYGQDPAPERLLLQGDPDGDRNIFLIPNSSCGIRVSAVQ